MKFGHYLAAPILVMLVLSGCSATHIKPGIVPAAPTSELQPPFPNYLIGARDVLSINVYKEPDLSLPQVVVESSGSFQMPLLGTIQASGKTTAQLSQELTAALGAKYLINPSVAVNVTTASSQKLTVEGAVVGPGVYDLENNTTLLSAIALAKGPTRVAKLRQIAIFRVKDGQRSVAVFDLLAIREGRQPDPQLIANDTVVVGFSGLAQAWQDFLQAVPAAAIFSRF